MALVAGYDLALLLGTVAVSLATVALVVQHTLQIPLTSDLRLGAISGLELARQALSALSVVILAALGAGVLPLLSVTLPVYAVMIVPTALLARGRVSTKLVLRPSAWPPLVRATLTFSLATAVGHLYVLIASFLIASGRA